MNSIKRLSYSALFLALCIVLPFLTGQLQGIGQMLCPMHIPVLLCGFICGWQWGAAVGFIAPFLRFLIFSMPPIFPMGTSMAFELATYGLVAGILYAVLPKKSVYTYASLLSAMIAGRVVFGVARLICAGIDGTEFTFAAFVSEAITAAIPGIICQVILIPLIITTLREANAIE